MTDPFLSPSVAGFLEQANAAPPADPSAAGQRAALDGAMTVFGWPATETSHQTISLGNGASIHLFAPESHQRGSLPLIVYLHGGSFIAGGAAAHGGLAQALADRTGALVALVDYRRTPEYPLPAALDDCLTGVRRLAGMAEELGFNPAQLTLLGDSAGGWLAANAVIALEKDSIPIARLVLINPMITPRPTRTDSREAFATGYFATTGDFDSAWAMAGDWVQQDVHPCDRSEAFRGFPPTVVITNEADPVRDEGEAFAEHLSAAGVTVVNLRVRGLIHAAWLFPKVLPEADILLDLMKLCIPRLRDDPVLRRVSEKRCL